MMILPSQRSGTALPTPGPSATLQTARPLSVLQLFTATSVNLYLKVRSERARIVHGKLLVSYG